ncbi:hypothetical protein Y032_0232g3064 [Ancylostoma ceylanicum]|uniref:Uncharacterized protein n=2 Tax=Ancylostoma ceylanicum TaxID=53326 RepID=A0A016SFF3_9BILA|nr:hypothetical protein Y032_0232g3064 [Ancylostoma ceylanicum]
MPTRVTPYAQHKDDNRFGRGTDLLILSIFPLSLGGGQGCVYRGSLMFFLNVAFYLPGIELLLERIRRREDVSGVAIMKWLRDRRYGAIQKGIQFVFMHYVIVELLCQEGVMKSDDPKVVAFQQKYQKLWTKQKQILVKNKAKETSLLVVGTQYDEVEPMKEKKSKAEKKGETPQKKREEEKSVAEKLQTAPESSSLTPQEPSLSLVPELMDRQDFSDYFEFL